MGFYRKISSFLDGLSSKNTVSFIEATRSIEFNKRLKDPGGFGYEEDGFTYPFEEGVKKIKWAEVERLEAYKADLNTTDEIRMNIAWNGKQFTITEETPGWYQFVEKTKQVFPSIPEGWDHIIVQPPFAANFTVLYEREDRVMPESNNFYAAFRNIRKIAIQETLEKNGWASRKSSWTDIELTNNWTELLLEGEDDKPLLNGKVAYHQSNVEVLNKLFDGLRGEHQYEYHDSLKNVLLEKKTAGY